MSKPFFQPKFNVNSWHARLHHYVYDESSTYHTYIRISICQYFWSNVLAAFLLPFVLGGRKFKEHTTSEGREKAALGFALSYLVFIAILGVYFAYLGFLYAWWLDFALVGIGTTIGLGVLGLRELFNAISYSNTYYRLKEALRKRLARPSKPKPIKPPKQPSVIMSYLKAEKSRVCPFIEWN